MLRDSESFTVRRIEIGDIAELQALRAEALLGEPLAFSAASDSDRMRDREFLVRSISSPSRFAVFGAFSAKNMVGMAGVHRSGAAKSAHRAEIWGMYVQPPWRGRGLGRQLLSSTIGQAKSWNGIVQVQLCVSATSSRAMELYERAGFSIWGCEPRALSWNGKTVDTYHLVLSLD